MKRSKLLCALCAIVMLFAAIKPQALAYGAERGAEELSVIPSAGDGVRLEYDEESFTVKVRKVYGLLRIDETKKLSLTAYAEDGFTLNLDYSNFFRDHPERLSVTRNGDGSVLFEFDAVLGDYLTPDEIKTLGVYATPDRLPKLEITASVPFSQIGKEEYVEASFKLTLGSKQFSSGDYEGEGSIKGRGNTSWGQPKKPYSIKLSKKVSLLDIPKTKKYAIVPGYSDNALIRNLMTYKASLMLSGIGYVPKCEFVEVYLNGTYNGIYILVERVSIESSKIDIEEASENDLTGGYLIEKDVDGKIDFDADQWFDCPYWANQGKDYFVLKEPEPEDAAVKDAMLSYLADYMLDLHNAVTGSSSDAYTKYVDVDSWADFIIIQELAKNIDGNLKTSCYMVKKSGDDKLYLTAPWDFDLAYGNPATTWDNADFSHNDYYDCPDATGTADFMVINSSCPWFDKLYDGHPEFRSAITERYAAYRETLIPYMFSLMDSQAAYLANAVPNDEAKWGVRFESGLAQLRSWFTGRVEWLDSVWLPDGDAIDLDFALNAAGGTLHFLTAAHPFTGVLKDGRIAGASGNAGVDSSSSTVTLTAEMKAGETISFDYKVSSESGYDKFRFKVNGSTVLTESGEIDWTHYTYSAPSDGSYTFVWEYKKDGYVSSGSDCAWIDNVALSGSAVTTLLGDVNNDGGVDTTDALLVLRYSMEIIDELTAVENADVDGDGRIGPTDALLILRYFMGIITEFPAG